ncbi:MAG: hypothetical protein LBD15_03015 [Holosporales bacterium]|nr:hypothetical protein [Holosporales bacterium]
MLHLSTFDLEKSLLSTLYRKEELQRHLQIMRIGSPLSHIEEPHLWVEVSKARVVGLDRVHAEGEIGVSMPLLKGEDVMSIMETIRNILRQPLPLMQGEQFVGKAYLEERSFHRNVKKEANLTVIAFDAFLRLKNIFRDI